jgi:hypothetical protein
MLGPGRCQSNDFDALPEMSEHTDRDQEQWNIQVLTKKINSLIPWRGIHLAVQHQSAEKRSQDRLNFE